MPDFAAFYTQDLRGAGRGLLEFRCVILHRPAEGERKLSSPARDKPYPPTVLLLLSPVAAGPTHLTLRAVLRLPSRPVGNLRDEALGQLRAQRVPLRPLRNDAARVRRASATAFGISGQGAEGGRRRSALAAPGRGRPRLLVRMCVRRPPGAWRRAAPRGRPSWLAGTRESVPSNPVAYSRPATPLF